jgi:hypothetical protein
LKLKGLEVKEQYEVKDRFAAWETFDDRMAIKLA